RACPSRSLYRDPEGPFTQACTHTFPLHPRDDPRSRRCDVDRLAGIRQSEAILGSQSAPTARARPTTPERASSCPAADKCIHLGLAGVTEVPVPRARPTSMPILVNNFTPERKFNVFTVYFPLFNGSSDQGATEAYLLSKGKWRRTSVAQRYGQGTTEVWRAVSRLGCLSGLTCFRTLSLRPRHHGGVTEVSNVLVWSYLFSHSVATAKAPRRCDRGVQRPCLVLPVFALCRYGQGTTEV
ncbi:hypothetical protein BaRGS_00021579, partial [Batillaria attramentaria]